VRNLTKVYRTRRGDHVALDNVSLEIANGEFVVLLGPSGCGKTTLLRCIAGLEEPDSGEIYINGRLVFSSAQKIFLPPEKRELNMVFQSYALWPHLSVIENVAYPLRNGGTEGRVSLERAREALGLMGLEAYGSAYPGQLSGGQQQRVALARAVVSGDGLVLFDEPLSNLDAKVRDRLRVELLSLQERIGFSAVYVTHDQMEALALADRIAVMDIGRFAQVGTPVEIYDTPHSRYVAQFVGSANEIEGEVVGTEGAWVKVMTPLGEIAGVAAEDGIATGQRVILIVRPEHCVINSTDGASFNVAEGVLERSLYLGSLVQHMVKVAETEITVSVSGGEPLESGAKVPVSFAKNRTRVFRM